MAEPNPFLEEIQQDVEEILISLEEEGLLLYARNKVYLVTERAIGKSALAGVPGRIEVEKTQLQPTPMVEVNTSFQEDFGVVQKVGNAKVSRIMSSRYTREQLEGADYYLIGDSPYSLVEGSLKEDRGGFFWSMILVRKQSNKKLSP